MAVAPVDVVPCERRAGGSVHVVGDHRFPPEPRCPSSLAMKDQADVCPLSWRVTLKPISTRLQGGLRFFRHPVPAHLSVGLAARLPVWEMYGVATFRLSDTG